MNKFLFCASNFCLWVNQQRLPPLSPTSCLVKKSQLEQSTTCYSLTLLYVSCCFQLQGITTYRTTQLWRSLSMWYFKIHILVNHWTVAVFTHTHPPWQGQKPLAVTLVAAHYSETAHVVWDTLCVQCIHVCMSLPVKTLLCINDLANKSLGKVTLYTDEFHIHHDCVFFTSHLRVLHQNDSMLNNSFSWVYGINTCQISGKVLSNIPRHKRICSNLETIL